MARATELAMDDGAAAANPAPIRSVVGRKNGKVMKNTLGSGYGSNAIPKRYGAILLPVLFGLNLSPFAARAQPPCLNPEFDNPDCPIVEPLPDRDANPVSMSVPTVMLPGQAYVATVVFRNTGAMTWTLADGFKLGSQNPADNATWGVSRVHVVGAVANGQDAVFTFTVHAPSVSGRYAFQWRMLDEGEAWFGPSTSGVLIDVVAGSISAAPANCTIPWGASTCASTISWTSNAPTPSVWVSALDNSAMQLMSGQQSGSVAVPWLNTGGHRFHLRNGEVTLSTVDVRGQPTVNQTPAVSLVSPDGGQAFVAGSAVTMSANASDADDGVQRVEFLVDGAKIAEDQSAPFAASWTAVAGTHALSARVFDTRGAQADSVVASIIVNTPPAPEPALSRRYVYDIHQRLCKVIEPETGATVMAYDATGNLEWSASGLDLPDPAQCDHLAAWNSGRRVSRSYDGRDRLQQLTFPDGNGNQAWSYTPDNLPVRIETANRGDGQTLADATIVNSYTYNKRRLLTGETTTQPGLYTWSSGYAYDVNGHLRSQSYPSGLSLDYAPNALGQPSQVRSASEVYASGVSYYANGAIAGFTYGNGLLHRMAQNARQLPSQVNNGTVDLTYAYDANGNITAIRDLGSVSGVYSGNRDLEYDGQDRLIHALLHNQLDERYTYDALDNLRSKANTAGLTQTYWYDSRNRLTNLRNAAGATVAGLAYDVQGNLENKNGQGYVFDYGNRLRRVTGKESYRYDGHGRRVLSKRADGTQVLSLYNNAGQYLYAEKSGATATEHIYLGSSLLAARERPAAGGTATIRYQHTDALGSPTAATNVAGQVLERTHYEPWGMAIGKTVDGVGYTGHLMDGGTGLTYMQQRYYDSQVGRFLSVDPIAALSDRGVNFNRYWYASNNSYSFIDPDGRWVCSGSEESCGKFELALNRVAGAAKSIGLNQGQRDTLQNSVDFYGKKNDTGVKVSFADLNGALGAATDKSVTIDISAVQRKTEDATLHATAKVIAHEGDHGQRMKSGEYKNITRMELEVKGYTAQALYQQAAGFMDWPGGNGWTTWGGIDQKAIEGQAKFSVLQSCGTITGCD